jgi:hypothetical protein
VHHKSEVGTGGPLAFSSLIAYCLNPIVVYGKGILVKKLLLFTAAVLLTSATFVSKPVYACVVDPDCDAIDCHDFCVATGHANGTCNWCTGACRCS